jgi:bifunctional non-homologous end joining protein LigD
MMARAEWRAPMLAQPLRSEQIGVLRRGMWLYERKLDGLRCLAVCNGTELELWSRNHLSFNRRFAGLVAALAALPIENYAFDGEIVALEGDRTSFARLQSGPAETQVRFCAFDVVHLLGRDTTIIPLLDRIALLERALEGSSDTIVTPERVAGDPVDLIRDACALGWEGLVAKRADARYRSGRSPDWRKLKCTARQDMVVGGWTDPSASRVGLGALMVGYYDDEGRLHYAGRVGSGFDEKNLVALRAHLAALGADRAPFVDPEPVKGAHWVRPELVAEVEFSEWTPDGKLRHPRYLGLRPDVAPTDVRRE